MSGSIAVIFGGTGFIGVFFAKFILDNNLMNKVYLVDIQSANSKSSAFRKKQINNDPRMVFVSGDVRNSLDWFSPPESVSLIANFAAVHREPGHQEKEYYETNLLGAENVCAWAEKMHCNRILFTSSISPYGVGDSVKDESLLPVPTTAYGGSKLVAEKIHQIWQAKEKHERKLVIVRPGVVFGPGEGGNVSRLIKAVIHKYFFYMGNRHTRKAGVYVKELCRAMWWVLQRQENSSESVVIFNMTMNPGPSVEEYVNGICEIAGIRPWIPSLPYWLLLFTAYVIDGLARPFNVSHPFNPVRITKLVRSNNVLPTYLTANGYKYAYTLKEALLDWRRDCPEEWC